METAAKTGDFVVLSKVRVGLKREFAFAIKSHNEAVGSLGRTRARSNLNESNGTPEPPLKITKLNKSSSNSAGGGDEENGDEAVKSEVPEQEDVGVEKSGGEDVSASGGESEKVEKLTVESEEEPKSDVVDPLSDDDIRCQAIESLKRKESAPSVHVVASGCEQKTDAGLEDDLPKGNADIPVSKVPIQRSVGEVLAQQSPAEVKTQEVPMNVATEDGDVATDTSSAEKGVIKTIPRRLKDLLQTGLLEGLPVQYVRGYRSNLSREAGLRGVINGCKVLCFCKECHGASVVTPNQFELHAGSPNKRPIDYTYLENGSSLRDVLNACKASNLDNVEAVIKDAVGTSSERKNLHCDNCKGIISGDGIGRAKLLCRACLDLKPIHEISKLAPDASSRPAEAATRKSSSRLKKSDSSGSQSARKLTQKPAEAAAQNSSASFKKSCSPGSKSDRKLTRKFLGLHKLALQDDVLPDGTEVGYYAQGKKLLSGYKKGSGIFCMCCLTEVSPSQFEAHAGMASRRKPYLHIYTSNGVSLHELSVRLNQSQSISVDENDEVCRICSEPGDLLCCDGCPRVYHLGCIQLPSIPEGTWYCRYCKDMYEREKYAECNANAIAAGRVAGVDPIEQITNRCIRIAKIEDSESDGCALCRGRDFTKGGFGPRTVIICDQCEKEFHVGCLRSHGIENLKEVPKEAWLCCHECKRIHSALQQLLQDGPLPLPDPLVDSIKKKYADKGLDDENLDIKWRLLSGKMSSYGEIRTLLAEAVSVFHEQFTPIMFPGTNHDMIPHMIYGRSAKGKDFGGMYCAVLTVNNVIVSAGVFRVFGNDVAELPLVATASSGQKLGYFQALFASIEKLLGDLEVKDLWVPAAEEVKSFWTDKFGFLDFPMNEYNEQKKLYNVMIFDGTFMLRKGVPKRNLLNEDA